MPWYKEVSRQEWKTFLTTFAAWTLDAFDFTIITFVLTDIRRSFEVNLALAGALATVTLFFRMIGGIGAGTLADRYGRKGPILFAIAWYKIGRASCRARVKCLVAAGALRTEGAGMS